MRAILAFTVLLVIGASLFYAVSGIPFGEPAATAMDDYYLRHGQEQTGANNIVTSVLFDYRGFDTLGEATVLFAAVLGVGALFRQGARKDEETPSS